jgi:hypothetical protein
MNFEYLVYSLMFLGVWVVIYRVRPDLRESMLHISVRTAPIGPLSQLWFLSDYWRIDTITNTTIGLEDFIFAFSIGGISWSIYKAVFNKRINTGDNNRKFALSLALSTILVMIIFVNIFNLNSVLVSATWFILLGAYLISKNSYPTKVALLSGFLVTAVFLLVYVLIQQIYPWAYDVVCAECNPSNIRILGVNLEELYWDFSWGFLAAPAYDLYMRVEYTDD